MSWDISLQYDDGKVCTVARHTEGAIYAVGGVDLADLNVTYNYGKHFAFGGLHGCEARDTVAELRSATMKLGTVKADDYWEATEGNAGFAASILLAWAEQHPGAIWHVR